MSKPKFPLTTASLSLILKELKAIFKITNIIIQVLLITFYGWMIYQHINNYALLACFSLLTLVSLIAFTLELILESSIDKEEETVNKRKIRKASKRQRRLIFGITKYVARITILVFVIIEIVKYGGSDLKIIATILSAVLIIVNVLVDVITYLVQRYILMIRLGFYTDMQTGGIVHGLIRRFTKDIIDYDEGLGELTESEKEIILSLEKEAARKELEKDKD